MQDFHKLKVWEQAHALTLNVYTLTAKFPGDERYGLVNQLRRSSASIGANLAEACGRGQMQISRAMSRLPWGQPAKLNITCCSQEIYNFY